MEFTVFAHLEQTPERPLVHFLDRFANGDELVHDVGIISGFLVQSLKNFQSFVFSILHHKPTGRFWKVEDREENHHGEKDLESQRETPGNFQFSDKGKACFN
jgi:hypothetical protein